MRLGLRRAAGGAVNSAGPFNRFPAQVGYASRVCAERCLAEEGAPEGFPHLGIRRIDRMIYLDFATCPYGHSTPIRPSRPAPEGVDQKWTQTESVPLFVACSRCKRVYKIEDHQLKSRPSTCGLSPYHEEAQLHVFEVPIDCDDPAHEFQLPVIAVRNADTIGEDAQKWRWADGHESKCPLGHEISLPPWE